MSEVVLGQMRHLGPGTDDALIDHVGSNLGCPMTDGTFWTWDRQCSHRPCREQPWMSQVVLGQMGHIGPGIVDALTDHVGNNLGCPR